MTEPELIAKAMRLHQEGDPEKAIERGAPKALETFTDLTKRLLCECFVFLDKGFPKVE